MRKEIMRTIKNKWKLIRLYSFVIRRKPNIKYSTYVTMNKNSFECFYNQKIVKMYF